METAEEEAAKAYADAGVELPELQEEQKEEAKVEPEAPKEPEQKEETPEAEEPEEPLKEEQKEERKPRSIYDEYKEKKSEARTNLERAEQAERERDELATKLQNLSKAETVVEKQEAQDELDQFMANHSEWDKPALQDLVDLARKGVKPELDPNLAKDLEDFKAWKADNAKVIEESMFAKEFEALTPTLKEMFPTASDEEMKAIKEELDTVSHTEDYHDKELEYVAFKHKEKLAALVSPKKRGMESKGRKDEELQSYDFNPEADLAKMTPTERQTWEEQYAKLSKNDGLVTDPTTGRKTIL